MNQACFLPPPPLSPPPDGPPAGSRLIAERRNSWDLLVLEIPSLKPASQTLGRVRANAVAIVVISFIVSVRLREAFPRGTKA